MRRVWGSLSLLVLSAGCLSAPAQEKSLIVPGPAVQKIVPEHRAAAAALAEAQADAAVLAPRNAMQMPPFREWGEKETAIDALGRIGTPAVPALIESLRSTDAEERELAAKALSRIGPDARGSVRDLMAQFEQETSPAVRLNIIRALGQIGQDAQSAVPLLIRIIQQKQASELPPVPSKANAPAQRPGKGR